MNRIIAVCVLAGMLVTAGGCAHNAVVAHNTTSSGTYYGTDGIWGNDNTRTIERDSRVDKISIFGDGNTYYVEDHVRLRKVEICGKNNTISIPESLVIQWTTIGEGNKLIRRHSGDMDVPAAVSADAPATIETAAEEMPAKDRPDSP